MIIFIIPQENVPCYEQYFLNWKYKEKLDYRDLKSPSLMTKKTKKQNDKETFYRLIHPMVR